MAPIMAQSESTQPVTNVTTGATFETIAEALNVASSGDVLNLAGYRFTEHIAIDVPLTLTGAEGGTTVIDVSQQDGWGITLSSDNITLKNLSILAGDVNTAYAIHSEPGITGLTLEDIAVYDSHRTCIDLNGLTGPNVNTLRNLTVSGSSIGFGLAMSSCSNMLIENITSSDNGYGDIAIMESNYYDQEISDVVFTGFLDLEGPQNLGGGGIIVQVSPEEVPVGAGAGFPISVNSTGFDYVLEAPGDLTGCILVHSEDVRAIAQTLGANVAPLVSYDLVTQNLVVFPGMSIQNALDAASDGDVIEVDPGSFDSTPLQIAGNVTLKGANAGISGTSTARSSETLVQGIVVTDGTPIIDGIQISGGDGTAGLVVMEAAAGVELRNSIISGNGTETGVICRNSSLLHDVVVESFAKGIQHLSGALAMESSVIKGNGTGVSIEHTSSFAETTTLQNCQLLNTGGTGILVQSGGSNDLLTIENSTIELHATGLNVTGDISLAISGNVFVNSEDHTMGLDREARIALCSSNGFEPALRINGCTDNNADNFEPCATVDQGCEFHGCTAPKACNYDASATTDDGSCDFITCSACPLGFACNYDPDADLYRVEACEFLDCGEGMAGSGEDRGNLAVVEGCTIPQACNFNPNADSDDGSCNFGCYGCQDEAACNFDAVFTQASNETCLYQQDLHNSPYVGCDGACVNDTNENGVCDEEEVTGCTDEGACNFSASATLDVGDCEYASCAGCTNPGACNHDPSATLTDASCDYTSCAGCTDSGACNYNAMASIDDGTCSYPLDLYNKPWVDCTATCLNDADGDGVCDEEETSGCMESGACNYDEEATEDDGTCEYESCSGCTDDAYCNFNPGATINDGSCAAPEDLFPNAIVDGVSTVDCLGRCLNDEDGDGICDEAEIVCPGDLNGDGLRGASDILVMLSAFGCTEGCGSPDLNGDGIVAASDVLMALSTFGVACPQ